MKLSTHCAFIDIHTHSIPLNRHDIICSILNVDLRSEIWPKHDFNSLGIHPWWLEELTDEQCDQLLEKLRTLLYNQRAVAIGECGLDRLRGGEVSRQERVFRRQIELAIESRLSVIIHNVKSDDLCLKILRDYQGLRFCIHGFNRKPAAMEAYLKLGGFISFGHAIMHNDAALKSLRAVPEDAFFLETDNSGLPIEMIYQSAADARNLSLPELQQRIKLNYDTWTKES